MPVGLRFAVVLVSPGVFSVGRGLHLCQDTALQKPPFPPVALTCPWLHDHSDSSNAFVFCLLARKLFKFFF